MVLKDEMKKNLIYGNIKVTFFYSIFVYAIYNVTFYTLYI